MAKADAVDIMTYTVGAIHPQVPYRRVLINAEVSGPYKPLRLGRVQVRALCGIHSKVWLAWTGRIMEAYVGSFNLTAPTNENVMVRVDNNKKEWLLYFDHFWAQGRILS